MTPSSQAILAQALALPETDRAEIADHLLESIPVDGEGSSADPGLHPDWEAEIARRLAEMESGSVVMIPWEDVQREVQEIIGRAKTC